MTNVLNFTTLIKWIKLSMKSSCGVEGRGLVAHMIQSPLLSCSHGRNACKNSSQLKCNGRDVSMNGTTSVPKSILRYVVDKVRLFVPI